MTPYQKRGRGVYYGRVGLPDGRERTVSLGTDDRQTANEVEAFALRMKSRRRWDVLSAVVEDRGKLPDAYDADVRGELDSWVQRLNDPDLDQWLETWEREGANAKYVTQCRRLIAKGKRFAASDFARARVSAFLAALPVDTPTKNRYRAALSQFARFLVEREIMEHNPVRDVKMYRENAPRAKWMPWEQAVNVVLAAKPLYRPVLALCYGAGVEIGAALQLRASDIGEPPTVRIRGTKTKHRDRIVRVEAWAWEIMRGSEYLTVGESKLFPLLSYDAVYRAHRDALRACHLDGFTLHDARHTYAVNALKKGYDEQVVAHQLGHKDASMVRKIYGRYVPSAEDYETTRNKAGSATDSATAKRMRVK